MKRTLIVFCLLVLAAASLFPQQKDFPILRGPYLGQKPPGSTPELFAPGVVSTDEDEYAFEISPSGDEMLFARAGRIMLVEKKADGTWNSPAITPFSGKNIDGECCFSPDGTKIFFSSRRPIPGAKMAANVWVSEKSGGIWGIASHFDKLAYHKEIHALSVAANGNVYDSGIVRFEFVDGKYSSGEGLIPPIDGRSPFVAPDESYIIFSKRPPGRSDPDLHITFRKNDGTWTGPVSLGDQINTSLIEANSFLTADGKYFFFTRKFDVYWVRADFIQKLKPVD